LTSRAEAVVVDGSIPCVVAASAAALVTAVSCSVNLPAEQQEEHFQAAVVASVTGTSNMDVATQIELIPEKETASLQDKGEWLRMQKAIIRYIDSKYPDPKAVNTDDEDFWQVDEY
jgi:hypothetical protein